jgi:hypothetical protein
MEIWSGQMGIFRRFEEYAQAPLRQWVKNIIANAKIMFQGLFPQMRKYGPVRGGKQRLHPFRLGDDFS